METARMQQLALALGLSALVGLNLTLLIWLLGQLSLPVPPGFTPTSGSWSPAVASLQLIGKVLLEGQLKLRHMAPGRETLYFRSSAAGLQVEHHGGVHVRVLPRHIEAMVPGTFTVRSAFDDRLLLLAAGAGGSSQRTFVDHIELRGRHRRRLLSIRNGAIQLSRLNGTECRLSAPTNRIRLRGTRRVHISANTAAVRIGSRRRWTVLRATRGAIRCNASGLQLTPGSIRTVVATRHGRTYLTVGQVCLCRHTGRLFAAPPNEQCSAAAWNRCRW